MASIGRVQISSESGAFECPVAVPAALHDQAQVVRPREVHGGGDIGGLLGRDRVRAGRDRQASTQPDIWVPAGWSPR